MKKLIPLLILIVAVTIVGCASSGFARRYPDATSEEVAFVNFLTKDGHVTPSLIEDYLTQQGIPHHLKQDPWDGVDVWTTGNCGGWTARYTGNKRLEQEKGEPFRIPADNSFILNKPRKPWEFVHVDRKKLEMHVYYDSISNHSRDYMIKFDRNRNEAKTPNKTSLPTGSSSTKSTPTALP